MGTGNYSSRSFNDYSQSISKKSRDEIFSQGLHSSMNPKGVIREARDSVDHPNSTPIIIGFDVTGSMGMIPEHFIKKGLGVLMNNLFDTQPVPDPQIMVMGIGDELDRAPLQVSQFESDNRIVTELEKIWLEGRGYGNGVEGYNIPWLFAARQTVTDNFQKRGQKGYLFTIGDERLPEQSHPKTLSNVLSCFEAGEDLSSVSMLAEASKFYNCFHLIIEEGGYFRQHSYAEVSKNPVTITWREVIGRRAILVDNYSYLSDIVSAVIRVNEGADPEDVINESDKAARASIRHALFD